MNVITANIIIYLTRYAYFIRALFKNRYIRILIDILKWGIFAYAFFLVKGYSATLCYLALIIYEAFKVNKITSHYIFKVLLFLLTVSTIYIAKKYSFIILLPYVALFLFLIIKPLFKKAKQKNIVDIICNVIICIVSYNYQLYVLFVFKVMEIAFPAIGNTLRGITEYTNKRTSN